MSVPSIVALGAGTPQHRHPLARRREDARGLGAARKEPHWIIRWYGTEVQLDRVRQLRHKRVDDKQQTQGRALRGWSNRVTIHRRTASRILKLLLIVPIVNDVFEDMYISFWYAYEEIARDQRRSNNAAGRGQLRAPDSVGNQGNVHVACTAGASCQSVQGRHIAASAGDARDDPDHGKCRAQCHEAISRCW